MAADVRIGQKEIARFDAYLPLGKFNPPRSFGANPSLPSWCAGSSHLESLVSGFWLRVKFAMGWLQPLICQRWKPPYAFRHFYMGLSHRQDCLSDAASHRASRDPSLQLCRR